jgi:hypothetical protein
MECCQSTIWEWCLLGLSENEASISLLCGDKLGVRVKIVDDLQSVIRINLYDEPTYI